MENPDSVIDIVRKAKEESQQELQLKYHSVHYFADENGLRYSTVNCNNAMMQVGDGNWITMPPLPTKEARYKPNVWHSCGGT